MTSYPSNTLPGTYLTDENSTTTYMYDVILEPTLRHIKTTPTHCRNARLVESASDPPVTVKADIGFSTLPMAIGSQDATGHNSQFHPMLSPKSIILGHTRECPPHSRLATGMPAIYVII